VKILLSNDDGYRAEGIRALHEALKGLGAVTLVAPDRNRSGASNSLTLDVPLRIFEAEPGVYYVPGTPTDCVHLALSGVFEFEHDMVVSGVNDGENLGDDVLPTVAVSLCTEPGAERHFATAAIVARRIVALLQRGGLERSAGSLILNVNVPNLPLERIRGVRATRLGFRHRSERVQQARDPKGRPVYWVGPAGYVSVTPLQIDLTRHAALPVLERWLGGLDG
jgi:5'-nucleotidase